MKSESEQLKSGRTRLGVGVIAALTVAAGVFSTTPAAKRLSSHLTEHPQKEVLNQSAHAFNEIAKRAMPSVVSIAVVKRLDQQELLEELAPLLGRNHEGTSHNPLPPLDRGQLPRSLGIGSGVIIRPDGHILTNYHVVEYGEKIMVTFDEKHKLSAHVVGVDRRTDLAVIKVDAPDGIRDLFTRKAFPTLAFGDSDQIRVGDWAIAIGSPFGLNRTVTSGIISAKGRGQVGLIDIEDFIQTDASINPGSSGGPLLNTQGEIIGLNTAIFSEGGGSIGIGFAIPSSIVKDVSDQLIRNGHVSRGWLGLAAQDLDPELARYFKLPGDPTAPSGALISEVYPEGPAGHTAIKPGDVVVEYDHHKIASANDLRSLVGKTQAGRHVTIGFYREGKAQSLDVPVAQQPLDPVAEVQLAKQNQQAGQAALARPAIPGFGMTVEDVPQEIDRALKLPPGSGAIVVSVKPGTPASDSGMEPGDIVLKVGNDLVHGAKEFRKATDIAQAQNTGKPSVLYVQRGPKERVFVSMKYDALE